jgi:putative oligomerization/nucleic acid binding protein
MQQLTEEGRRIVRDVAHRHGFSDDAVTEMLSAVAAGNGNQAQFNHPEFGGMGQWSSGGMLMIGDMFNYSLKGRVGALCQELSSLVSGQPLLARPAQSQTQSQGGGRQNQMPSFGQHQIQGGVTGSSLFVAGSGSSDWWPPDLGMAGSVGAQNNIRYAYFPAARRLAIDVNGQVTIYDTGAHQIGGFSQQQSGDQSLLFTSQFGLVRVADLPVVSRMNVSGMDASGSRSGEANPGTVKSAQPAAAATIGAETTGSASGTATTSSASNLVTPEPLVGLTGGAVRMSSDEVLSLIEKVAELHAKSILTDAEFEAKKAELLSRL